MKILAGLCEYSDWIVHNKGLLSNAGHSYRGADKFLARPRKKQATETEDFDFHISYL